MLRVFCFLFLTLGLLSFSHAAVLFEKGELPEAMTEQDFSEMLDKAGGGNARAQFLVGMAYANGLPEQNVRVDKAKALEWLKKSAAQEGAEAYYSLGQMYKVGYGVEKDESKWLEYTKKAAEQGVETAQRDLVKEYRMRERETGGEADQKQFIYWIKKLSKQGDPFAMISLSGAYETGKGVNQDVDKAFYWLEKSASESDNMIAQRYVGEYYAKGIGTQKDLVMAYMMYDLAGSAGSDQKKKLAKQMTPKQINEGIAKSRQWQEDHKNFRPSYSGADWRDEDSDL